MKEQFHLSNENIQNYCKEIQKVLQDMSVTDERCICTSMLSEEIFYIYQEAFGEDAEVTMSGRTKGGNYILTLTIPGKSMDPDMVSDAYIYRHLLKSAIDQPEWSYSGNSNVITFRLPYLRSLTKDIGFSWNYTEGKKSLFFAGVALQIVSTIFGTLVSLVTARLIVHYTDQALQQAVYAAIVIFVCMMVEELGIFGANRLYSLVSYHILSNVQKDLSDSVLNVTTGCMTRRGNGVFVQRLTNDTTTFSQGINTVMDLLIRIGGFVGILIAVCTVKPAFFFYEIAVIVLLYVEHLICARTITEYDSRSRVAQERYSGFITEMVRALTDIRTLHFEKPVEEELDSRVEDANIKQYQHGNQRWKYRLMTSTTTNVSDLVFMMLLAFCIWKGVLPPAIAIVLYNYHGNLGNSVVSTILSFTDFSSQFRLSCDRLYDLIHSPDYPKESFGKVHKDKVEGRIEFRDVTFAYHRRGNDFFYSERILKKLSFVVEPGQVVAFVGASGCGKSTIFRLLNKQYTPAEGKILLDDIDIDMLDKDTLRGSMSMVTQSPYIFHDSIRRNLEYVKPDLSDEEMEEVCKAACIYDDIKAMPDCFDTVIGEGGIDLSGGQKQRLAIARSLLVDSSIYILDEATSALDNETQAKVLESINKMKKNQTILMIAHRLSTVIYSDVIFFVHDGKILASGTHNELMETCESYKSLYMAEAANTQ